VPGLVLPRHLCDSDTYDTPTRPTIKSIVTAVTTLSPTHRHKGHRDIMRRRYHPYDNVRRLAERVNAGFIAPVVRTGINNAVNLVQAGLEQVPEIVWDMDAEVVT